MHYFQWNIKSYQAATTHLSNEEDLAYRRLIELYYDTEQPIPSAIPVLSRRLRVGIPVLENVLNEFFVLTENGWKNEYCDTLIHEYHVFKERQRINGSKGGRGNKADAKPKKATVKPDKPSAKPTINHKQETTNHKPETKGKSEDLSSHAATTKGTRLPEDWILPKAWGEWALAERPELTADDVRKMAESFKDYWLANANRAIGKKADWQATWRNWVRNQKVVKPNGTDKGPPWWSSNETMIAKGKELGLSPKSGENWGDFKSRIQAKISNRQGV